MNYTQEKYHNLKHLTHKISLILSISNTKIMLSLKKYITSPFSLIIIIGLLLRAIIIYTYTIPIFTPDSYSYKELASYIINGKLLSYPGWRTPGYPMLLFITLGKYYIIEVILQIILSIVSTFFIYDILRRYSLKLAFVISLFFFTLMKVAFYEFSIITESTTLFTLLLSVWLIEKADIINKSVSYKKIIIISLALTFCFLIRPMFIYIAPILVFFMIFNIKRGHYRNDLSKILVLLTLPFSAYFGWSTLNYHNNDWFTVTVYAGVNLSQTTVGFFSKAPDKYQVIREIYQKHIDNSKKILDGNLDFTDKPYYQAFKNLAENNDFETIEGNSIWRAYSELKDNTKMSDIQLSHKLYNISKELIINNPKEYLIQVAESWMMFWKNKDLPIKDEQSKNLYLSYI